MAKPTLVVLAAGMGSRFGGLKQIQPVGPSGEVVLDYSVYDAIRAGFGQVVFVIRREIEGLFREQVLRRFEGRVACELAFQELDSLPEGFGVPAGRTKPWGTAHAILCARAAVRTPFLAINADDFYGREAFERLGAFLRGPAGGSGPDRYAMAGYALGETLSEFGTVARGVCEVDDSGRLVGIVERTGIAREGDRIVCATGEGTALELAASQPVSMNFWGFTPSLFPRLEALFRRFLEQAGAGSEFYIPAAVFSLIRSGECTVEVLPTYGRWCGVTYREDQPHVEATIRSLVAAGEYPARLSIGA